MKSKLNLKIQKGNYAVCLLGKDSKIPEWANGEFFSITKTEDELSIVCKEEIVPESIKCEKGWVRIKVIGPLDFSLTGILASLADPLAFAGISIFAISTFDTDYLLIKKDMIEKAKQVLLAEGHNINL
jgi:hypothetical protein